jgi:hypothetical protein
MGSSCFLKRQAENPETLISGNWCFNTIFGLYVQRNQSWQCGPHVWWGSHHCHQMGWCNFLQLSAGLMRYELHQHHPIFSSSVFGFEEEVLDARDMGSSWFLLCTLCHFSGVWWSLNINCKRANSNIHFNGYNSHGMQLWTRCMMSSSIIAFVI